VSVKALSKKKLLAPARQGLAPDLMDIFGSEEHTRLALPL
jgi:hypothetical protein